MDNKIDHTELPLGFAMALAQNIGAMEHFASLSTEKKRELIAQTHNVNSKREMQQFVRDLAH